MKDRTVALKAGDNWATPKKLYNYLDNIHHFNFDPCPLCKEKDITPDKDGLLIEWGKSNFVNPPYSRKLKPKFIRKAVEESRKGKKCILLIPAATGNQGFHKIIVPNANEIIFIEGRVPYEGVNTKGEFVTTKCGMHDSMIVVFDITHKTELKYSYINIKEIMKDNNTNQLELF